jgi:hypothetical protein|eukprot:COSAG02_NODE_3867_length_6121_cov_1.789937_10_plen_84_part_00
MATRHQTHRYHTTRLTRAGCTYSQQFRAGFHRLRMRKFGITTEHQLARYNPRDKGRCVQQTVSSAASYGQDNTQGGWMPLTLL